MKAFFLGPKIQEIRKNLKIRQKKLAEEAGISKSFLSEIESGEKDPSLKILEKISRALGVPWPVIALLSVEKADWPEDKQLAWENLGPEIKRLITEIMSDQNFSPYPKNENE